MMAVVTTETMAHLVIQEAHESMIEGAGTGPPVIALYTPGNTNATPRNMTAVVTDRRSIVFFMSRNTHRMIVVHTHKDNPYGRLPGPYVVPDGTS